MADDFCDRAMITSMRSGDRVCDVYEDWDSGLYIGLVREIDGRKLPPVSGETLDILRHRFEAAGLRDRLKIF